MPTADNDAMGGVALEPVSQWLLDHVPDATAPFTFRRVAGGHSCLTYLVDDAAGRRIVLRRPPLGAVLHSAHDVAREHQIMAALAGTGVPVPTMLGLCTDLTVNDAPFYVMSFVAGSVVHNVGDVAAHLPTETTRRQAAESLVDALALLHAVDVDAVELTELVPPTSYLERQVKRWTRQWEDSRTRELPGMDRLAAWLRDHRPAEVRRGIVHGDYRLGNVIHGPDGTVVAILDWELCTVGDPLADVSYLLNSWADPAAGGDGPPSSATGFPTRDELVARYAQASGTDPSDLHYWSCFHAWRSAAICEGVYRRYVDGDMGEVPADVDRYREMVDRGCARGLELAGIEP
jgi:aminoglycoside phosphotransferase (APT) family kinase protein